MAQPYIGEIRMFAGNFAPNGWMFCDGQLIPISENDALFNLIGTTYGGDGQDTFGLPNLQSRVPMHMGKGSDGITYTIGETIGVESVTLSTQQMPQHSHSEMASTVAGSDPTPAGNILATSGGGIFLYYEGAVDAPMAAAVQPVGGSQPHENCQPFLVINYIISLFGIFPTQT